MEVAFLAMRRASDLEVDADALRCSARTGSSGHSVGDQRAGNGSTRAGAIWALLTMPMRLSACSARRSSQEGRVLALQLRE